MHLYYDEYSNMQIDWSMIYVGWQGFAGKKLSAEQVIEHAINQIGRGTQEQDDVAALLANVDPQDWQTIDRYLGQIRGDATIDRETVVRKWRLSELKHFLQAFARPRQLQENSLEESLAASEDLYDFWLPFEDEGLPETAAMVFTGGGSVAQMLAEQQAWVERETIALRDETGAAK